MSKEPPQPATVEELLRRVGLISPSSDRFDLWVPAYLTMNGEPIRNEAAIAIVVARVKEISEDFVLAGFGGMPGGGYTYHFERWTDDPEEATSEGLDMGVDDDD